MPLRTSKLLAPLAALALAACAGRSAPPAASPVDALAYRPLALPALGDSRDAVLALNGAPTRREDDRGEEVWVYVTTSPSVHGLPPSRAIAVCFRGDRVVRTQELPAFNAGVIDRAVGR